MTESYEDYERVRLNHDESLRKDGSHRGAFRGPFELANDRMGFSAFRFSSTAVF